MRKRTFEDLQERASRYLTRGEFQKHDFNAYQIAIKRNILDQICAHMPKHVDQSGENNNNFKWTLIKLKKESLNIQLDNRLKKAILRLMMQPVQGTF